MTAVLFSSLDGAANRPDNFHHLAIFNGNVNFSLAADVKAVNGDTMRSSTMLTLAVGAPVISISTLCLRLPKV